MGKYFAKVCVENKASHVAIAARRVDRLEEIKVSLANENFDTKVTCLQLDVGNFSSIPLAMKKLDQEWGSSCPPDLLINNAGISRPNSILRATEQDFDDQMETNVKGSFFMMQACAKSMIAHEKSGAIINIASVLGLRPGKDLALYGTSKAAVVHMTKCAALDLAKYNIRVNCIAPGYIRTQMNAAFFDSDKGKEYLKNKTLTGRLGREEELSGALLLLATGTFINGECITVDGGHMCGSL